LQESKGDMDLAIQKLRELGVTKAGKKAGRTAAEGKVAIVLSADGKQGAEVEVNCETDFVARDEHFSAFVKAVAETALESNIQALDAFSALPLKGYEGQSVESARNALVAKVGENIQIRRIAFTSNHASSIGTYLHGNRIGVMVELDIDNVPLAKDIAMHIAASRPIVIAPEDVPADIVAKEKEIYITQAASSGKPHDIVEKMVAGRLKKYLDEVSLLGQAFVKDPDLTVAALLSKHRAKVLAFYRYEVGEGIEKVTEDFKEAVMSQIQGS
jgi:elongation factor Ts